MLPRHELARVIETARHVHHAGGPKVSPGEFILPAPANGDRLPGRLCQAGRFDGDFAGMLAPKAAAGVGHDDPHPLLRNAQAAGQAAAHSRGLLRARPDGELLGIPLRDGGPWLHWRVLDVSDLVAFAKHFAGGLEGLLG